VRRVLAATLLVAVGWAAPAAAQHSITWWTVDGGGSATTNGGGHLLAGTIGQHDAGTSTGGVYSVRGGFWRGGHTLVAVEEDEADAGTDGGVIPMTFGLHAAVPNPIVRSSTVGFDLPTPRFVRMRVYDATGRVARTLVEGPLAAGRHQHAWDGADDRGLPVPAGLYFLRLDTDEEHATRKVTVLR
jgi:hypothetical protein